MTAMIEFSAAMLEALAAFLGSEPVIYLFGMIVFCFLCKGIKTLMA